KNIDKMDKVLFLKNIKSNLEIFYFTREMSNLTFYGLIKESLERVEVKGNNLVEYSDQKKRVMMLLEDKILFYNRIKWKLLLKWNKKSEENSMEKLISLVERKFAEKFQIRVNDLENKYGEEVFETPYENELEIEDIIHNWDTFEHFLREYLEFY
ncbi:MAG: hypothetical protein KA448_06040, partial [Leptotrichiaceae bacterium]|nr:hypothetical protein [Leptotrichiaceae bacterium]MBP6168177.1 hypothetical protein [Leptotrichiaceae bacterium]MBP7026915.1 hypothetical protein [Leptotrichiaceae bacterium]